MQDVLELDAVALAELIRRKELTPLELVDVVIKAIERVNPTLNAVVLPMFEHARATAAAPLPAGPLAGVPFLLKDLLAEYAGVPLTEGSDFLAGYVPPSDSELVARYKRAGLIVVGKTNTPELGILPTTEPRRYGATRNPWAPDRTTGGSSGGSAAAVAARMVPMAHANDGGGSIRIPASCCGVFGLKPTRGRNPLGPYYGDLFGGLVSEHVVTRSVRDSAALLDVTAGPDFGDTDWGRPPRAFALESGSPPGRLRIAFSVAAPTGVAVHPDCVAAVHDVARLCAELGHDIVPEVPLPVNGRQLGRAFAVAWAAGSAWAIDDWARRTGRVPESRLFEPLTWALQERGRRSTAAEYFLARQDMQRASGAIARFFGNYDVWLTPVLAQPPVPLGTFDPLPDDPTRGLRRAAEFSPFTFIANVTGQPAMSVPLCWSPDGLPIGVHFLGRMADESTLFRLAAQLEGARPWAAKRPA